MLVYPVFGSESTDIARNYQFETALRLSSILDRQLVFTFVSSGCPACQEFEEQILSDPSVKELLDKHFVLSLISVDSTFEIELPGEGTVTNMELASGLGVKMTPTTYLFYPPSPGLKDNGIAEILLRDAPDPESMLNLLNRALTESFQEEKGSDDAGTDDYNCKKPVKEISREDFLFIQEHMKDGPAVVRERKQPSDLPAETEVVLDFALDDLESYTDKVLSETGIEKIYLLEPQED